jgi:FkbM family methyltransferase
MFEIFRKKITNLSPIEPVYTNIPGSDPIRLVSYYDEFKEYYADCELNTKKWFVENAQDDWVYLDCGANIGYYSILFSKLSRSGKVYAFEPTSTAEMLTQNITDSNCKNVEIFKTALGKSVGTKTDSIFRIWGKAPEKMEYSFTTIDQFVHDSQISKLDCIKIDVDSFDFEVLQGAEKTLREKNPWLVVELNHALNKRNQSNSEAFQWLSERGYCQALVIDHENYILKKNENLLPSSFSSFQLIYSNNEK